jgi:lysophospholipid acyltransferase 1/2
MERNSHRIHIMCLQLNFILTQIMGLAVAYAYRKIFTYKSFSYDVRLLGTLIPGLLLSVFCYGHDMIHLLALSALSYAGLVLSPAKHVHKVVLVISMSYLSMLHIYRMVYDYGGYILDISGPIMIGTQKVTSLAFSLHDGTGRQEKELTEEQKRYAVRRKPTIIEFFSYLLSFQTLMCGPLVYFSDYTEFIDGTNFEKAKQESRRKSIEYQRPSPTKAVLQKLAISTLFAILVLIAVPRVPTDLLADESFIAKHPFYLYVLYMIIATSAARFKYFFAWTLGETICNASGLGFSGYLPDGSPEWELVSPVSIWKLETSLNFKILLDNWNKTTQRWLKSCAYDRCPASIRTLATYVLSATWHGFYPGYYCCFLTAAFITTGARNGRRYIRPLFQGNAVAARVYDVITFCLTRAFLAYAVAPFCLLSFEASMKFYAASYYWGHILSFAGCLLPYVMKSPPRPSTEVSSKSAAKSNGTDTTTSKPDAHTAKAE